MQKLIPPMVSGQSEPPIVLFGASQQGQLWPRRTIDIRAIYLKATASAALRGGFDESPVKISNEPLLEFHQYCLVAQAKLKMHVAKVNFELALF
ncbi:hypothetical protein M514_02933 [Trichuris suis]|uniref:Uncharacterized protein n=1 Tax=Trichuris suis TaxID=68888 RepID=A0A085MG09_9BILA|nr:hypothetical protein M513_02933 [Trichuris suis]KFD66681.1 hypothetical protein M514_02933 [Trichuris suis]